MDTSPGYNFKMPDYAKLVSGKYSPFDPSLTDPKAFWLPASHKGNAYAVYNSFFTVSKDVFFKKVILIKVYHSHTVRDHRDDMNAHILHEIWS